MGESASLKDCAKNFCETKVKCVQKSYHCFSDNDINYKPSMKNVQSFHVIRLLTNLKSTFFFGVGGTPPMGGVK